MSADLLGARYQLIRETTRTPAFTIHEAFDHSSGSAVGVAVDRDPSPAAGLWRRSPGDRLARIRHPHVVSISDHGHHQGRHYLVFANPERSLSAALMDGPAGAATLERIVPLLASGLAALHRASLRLGQVHPGHVAFDASGAVRLAPWPFTDPPPGWGRPDDWSAPEVVAARTPTVAGDVWSFGAMLLAMLVGPGPGRLPAGSEASFVAPLQATVDPGLLGVIARSMATDPGRRFRSAAQLQAALVPAVGTHEPAPLPGAWLAGTWPPGTRLADAARRLVAAARSASVGGPSPTHRLRVAGGCSLAIMMLTSAALATRTLEGAPVAGSFTPTAPHGCTARRASSGARVTVGCDPAVTVPGGNTRPSRPTTGVPPTAAGAGSGKTSTTEPPAPRGAAVAANLVATAVPTAPAAASHTFPPLPATVAPMTRPDSKVDATPRPFGPPVASGDGAVRFGDGSSPPPASPSDEVGDAAGPGTPARWPERPPSSSDGGGGGAPGGAAGTTTWGTDR